MKNELVVRSGDQEFLLNYSGEGIVEGDIDGEAFRLDIAPTGTGFHVLDNNRGITVDIISVDKVAKTVELRINHKYYQFQVKDKYDVLLEKLGMNAAGAGKVSEIKAPMPGLVLDVMANPGDEIKADQPLIILEAMKMENVIKAPGDSVVKKIAIKKGDSVEKNQVLIEFE